jgi:hypothetical protein
MQRFNNSVLGSFVVWTDYVKFLTNNLGEVSYRQSNTKLSGYMDRHIGITVNNDNVLVAVAVSNSSNKKESEKTAKNVIAQRLINILENDMNIDAEDRGMTYVPKEMLDMLWKDLYTYKNLYGSVDPTYLQMALKSV